MDFATDSVTKDLAFEEKTKELKILDHDRDIISSMLIEAFDMPIADDLDFPEIYSRQRSFLKSDDLVSSQERMSDIQRVLGYFPSIDSRTIEVTNEDKQKPIAIYFRTKTNAEVSFSL